MQSAYRPPLAIWRALEGAVREPLGVYVSPATGGVYSAGPSVFRVPEMEAALTKTFAPDAVANIKVDPSPLMSDIHASADYRPPGHRHGQARGGGGTGVNSLFCHARA